MPARRHALMLGAVLIAAAAVETIATPARAQAPGSPNYVPNTYADFPYNQGSLFYRYRPYGSSKPRRTTPRYVYPRTYTPPAGYYYAQPPQTYAQPPQTYAQPPQTYYYYPQGAPRPY